MKTSENIARMEGRYGNQRFAHIVPDRCFDDAELCRKEMKVLQTKYLPNVSIKDIQFTLTPDTRNKPFSECAAKLLTLSSQL